MAADGFTKVETKEERRKRKKVEKRRPQFQFDMSAFKNGKKVGLAVGPFQAPDSPQSFRC